MSWECRLIQALWWWVFLCKCQPKRSMHNQLKATVLESEEKAVRLYDTKNCILTTLNLLSQWPAVLRLCWDPLWGGETHTVKGNVLSSPDWMHFSRFCCRWFCGRQNESCTFAIFTVKHTLMHRLASSLHRDICVSTSGEGWLLL